MSPHLTPIPDQSHVNKVRDHLWSRPNAGASVMVGSGFSRNAVNTRPGTSNLPLWSDIAKAIFSNLYPSDSSSVQNQGSVGQLSADRALRLAQEYKTAFGRTDLHRLLGQLVPDNHFRPGDAHLRLLHLPWRDVFTTNWDTLLERASERIAERGYSIIQDMDQIPLMSQPRIVKLHGSFPSNYPLIVTEEDYRTYPKKFAPFVNTVQQAMMETIFLLIGFSGEDPNFLSWSGWIRDNLGDAAPKIYLAGWLNLSRHRRRMLEDRGVVSIDLAHHQKAQTWPEHQRDQFAIEWLLYTLETARPYDETMWPSLAQERKIVIPGHLEPVVPVDANRPQSHPDTERNTDSPLYGKESLERIKQVLKSWTHNRNIYPGWLMLPSGEQRFHLSRRTDEWEPPILSALPDLTPVERLFALRELAWRREILLEPITVDFVAAATGVLHSINCETKTVEGIEVTRDDWTEVREAWRVVALSLLTDARLEGNEGVFQKRLEALRPYSSEVPDVEHRVYHERCLWAMYSLDIAALNDLLDNWSVENCDPAWMLRKAALLARIHRRTPMDCVRTGEGG